MAKKKDAHHGGAWKVAFADFMTAMMALFLVLWISAQDDEILIATSQYFQNPFNSPMDRSSGVMPFDSSRSMSSLGEERGTEKETNKDKQLELIFLNTVAADFYRLLHLDQTLAEKPIDISITSDGLRVTLFDRSNRPLFNKGTAEFTESGRYIMQSMAWMIERHHFRVTIDGHSNQNGLGKDKDYSAWELSADRANAARRSLVHYAVDTKYIERVTGYAGTRPLPGEKPEGEANERVTLSLTLSSKLKPEKSDMVPENSAVPAAKRPALSMGIRHSTPAVRKPTPTPTP